MEKHKKYMEKHKKYIALILFACYNEYEKGAIRQTVSATYKQIKNNPPSVAKLPADYFYALNALIKTIIAIIKVIIRIMKIIMNVKFIIDYIPS